MAKTESTAVNALIDLVQTATPLKPNPADDLMFAPPPKTLAPTPMRARKPSENPTQTVPPVTRQRTAAGSHSVPNMPIGGGVRVTTAPIRSLSIPPIHQAPPPHPSLPPPLVNRASGTPAPELFSRAPATSRPAAPASMPIAAPFEARPAPTASHADMTSSQPWFDAHQTNAHELDDEAINPVDGTQPVGKQASSKLVGKLVLPTVGLVIVGVFVGGFIAFDGAGGSTKVGAKPKPAAPIAVAVAAPAPPPIDPTPVAAVAVAEPVAPAPEAPATATPTPGVVAFVDVRIDSQPSGATVMLVDKGKTTFLGTTPISTSLDPAHGYDVVFAYESQPTQLEHLEPSVTTHMSIVLGKPAVVAAAAKPAHPPAPKLVATAALAPTAPVKVAPVKHETMEAKAPAATGSGTLMIASKPPCEIYVDGKATGLTTPQRAIPLSAGTHKITLIGASDKSVKKTVAVQITANQPTKVIQDLMAP